MSTLLIHARNINDAFAQAMFILRRNESALLREAPRGVETLEWPYPVVTTYERPRERVLFDAVRDANPFFHFFEPLWMLAGRSDVAFVEQFVRRMRKFSDDGQTLHGAYGNRWRLRFGVDQIQSTIQLLTKEPSTRRAVIQMWSVWRDMDRESADLPCNTHVYFKLRAGVLRATVLNRSNDVLWGAYGANMPQFSMLQEYVAAKVGAAVGPLVQVSDSWHVYTEGPGGELYERLKLAEFNLSEPYARGEVRPAEATVTRNDAWDAELDLFFREWDSTREPERMTYVTPFWKTVALPLWRAWKYRDVDELDRCSAYDWRLAAARWLRRRQLARVK